MSVTLWVTEDCQLNCIYCYEGEKSKAYMNEETALSACHFALEEYEKSKSNKRFLLQLHGGEPLLNEKVIFKICKYISDYFKADRRKYGIRMTTNGLLVTEKNLPLLIRYIEQISISIDGKKETHDRNRKFINNMGSFDLVFPKAKMILKEMPNTVARMTIAAGEADKLFDNIVFLFEAGFRWVSAVMDESDRQWNDEIYGILERQLEDCCDYIQLQRRKGKELHLGLLEEEMFYRKNSPCDLGRKDLHIAADGKLYACNTVVGMEEFCVGDIFHGWNENIIQELILYNKQKNDECTGCVRYDFCPANRCKVINKVRTGYYNRACMGTCYQQNLRVHAHSYFKK